MASVPVEDDYLMSTRVILVDDHPLLRDGLRKAIEQQAHLELAGEAFTIAGATRLAADTAPDLVLLDIHLPDGNGLDAARQILADWPNTKIMIFSADPDRSLVDQALKLGVQAYLLKTCLCDEVIRAINLVLAGKIYLSPEISDRVVEAYRTTLLGKEEPVQQSLSDRDRRLLQQIAQGRRNKEIAAEMALGIKAVETHRSRLMHKLGCSSPAELVRYAIREGIIDP